jgi:NADPH:quinone reductase-like Zn-dependent oxidoreductase
MNKTFCPVHTASGRDDRLTRRAGGVGLTAVEIGKAMGARVIAAAGSMEKLAVARSRGADELIDYKEESIRDRVRALTDGKGADIVYDPVGGDAFDQALRAVNWEARMLVIGFAAGRIQVVPANLILVKRDVHSNQDRHRRGSTLGLLCAGLLLLPIKLRQGYRESSTGALRNV